MYSKIIAGHDLHEGGRDAVTFGKQVAEATVYPRGAGNDQSSAA